jgi:Holliday junction resolvase RusA-like endonuclease
VEFTIPGHPQPKQRPRAGRGGHFYTPRETRVAEEAVALYARSKGVRFGDEAVSLSATFYFYRYQGDADNCLKLIADAIQKAGVITNDKQIHEWHAYVRFAGSAEEECTRVRINGLGADT